MTIFDMILSKLLGRDSPVPKEQVSEKLASDNARVRTPHICLRAIDGVLRPNFTFPDASEDFKGSLTGLLTNNGGIPDFPYLEWAEEGLQMLESVKQGELPEADWSTNSWCADIEPHQVIGAFAFNDNYYDVMPIDGVEHVLKSWIAFLRKGPDPDRVEEMEVYLY